MTDWALIKEAFERAMEMDADARAELIDELRGTQPELGAQLAAMLAAHEQPDSLVDRIAQPTPLGQAGPWRLLRLLGQGGMGSVYLGLRAADGFEQLAAVKLMAPGRSGAAWERRFRRERAILARLNHPGIAAMLDGGQTEDGQLYLAMELVEGVDLATHCEAGDLPLPERLRLFRQICAAVQCAHAQLIVHRDIKPSNILVDSEGRVKLLDFGIAQLLDDAESTQSICLTPSNASPEQLRGEPAGTASDVFALGMLLYRLVAGRSPFPNVSTSASTLLLQRELPPEPPSRFTMLPLRHPQELDSIVRCAMHPDPARRYATATQLADDVARYLACKPIQARPDSRGYRMRKFVQRHRIGVISASLALGVLLVATVLLTLAVQQTRQALVQVEQERHAAEQANRFLVGLFELADPTGVAGERLSARELLQRGARDLSRLGENDLQSRVLLVQSVAKSAINLGDFALALEVLDEFPAATRDLETQRLTALAMRGQGRVHEAENVLRVALATSAEPAAQRQAHYALALVLRDLGHYAEAEDKLRLLLAESPPEPDAATSDQPLITVQLGALRWLQGDFASAEAMYQQALTTLHASQPQSRPQIAVALGALSTLAHRRADYPEGEALGREALAVQVDLFGEDHPLVARSAANLGALLLDAGRHQEAQSELERALRFQQGQGTATPELANTLNNLGLLHHREGRHAEAAQALVQAIDIGTIALGQAHPQVAAYLDNLGLARLALEQVDEAEALFRLALDLRLATLGATHPHVGYSRIHLGQIAMHRGDVNEAVEQFGAAIDVRVATLGEAHELVAAARLLLAEALVTQQACVEAQEQVQRAAAIGLPVTMNNAASRQEGIAARCR